MLERLETQTTGRNCVQLYVDSMTCGIVTYRICDTISNQHNVVRAQIKCHTEWLCDHGLSAEPVLLDRADKCFRYLLGARSRTDLDARLRIWMTEVVPQIFSDDTELQEEYIDYMLTHDLHQRITKHFCLVTAEL